MIVKDLFLDCILNEDPPLAHYIHYLRTENKVSLDDDISKLDLNQADHEKVADMIKNNVLGFHKIGIYSLKRNKSDFVFIFASSPQEAIQFFVSTFRETPLNCHEYPLDFEFVRGNDVITFRDMRREHERYPAIAGSFRKKRF